MSDARQIIHRLDLAPHPEGGWYRESWRAKAPVGVRASASVILFLLDDGQRSHWHKVDADEVWLFHAGRHCASTARKRTMTRRHRSVSPAFGFDGFTLAPPDWSPGG